ncbi:MAG TPA: 16S rRNA (adenine(1518)-N(6)/adenine(1519)-N(6))-dimethyltransferase RsmA [Pirellulales bacterium]|jgi:16S rRNA (adenine1518-N6/adenine1519-N6)-dimethyltransferase|nr:16S rRNA (adenine(1518)-N(6)/adenine(1519)-N(6))-dimethyltransferase RsmA [Pirellulales bacterium]
MPNQTQTFLMRRFAEVGIQPKSRRGQNFLIDLNLLRLLADSAQLDPRDVVLEVGTGTGSLTGLVAPRVAHVVTVEVDPQMRQLASEELIDHENVTLLGLDVLHNKNRLNSAVMDEVRKQLAADPSRRFKLVANLPYNIATPLVSNLLADEPIPVSMTITIQKELADRMAAAPRTKDYGALSVWVQSQCDVQVVRIMPPTVFWPRPKVHSAIVHLHFRPDLRARIADPAFFHSTVRALFFHRRKFLRSVVASAFKDRLTKNDVDEVLAEQGLAESLRAEELSVEQILALCEALRRKEPQMNTDRRG